jgi:DnaJ like chaperone protein
LATFSVTLEIMSWFGKLMGGAFGFLMGGPLGAALGAALGHQVDQGGTDFGFYQSRVPPEEEDRLHQLFCVVLFKAMGHIAKADGRISEAEIACAREMMGRLGLKEPSRIMAIRVFSEGKRATFSLSDALDSLTVEFERHPRMGRLFVLLQTEAALADGYMHPAKETILLEVCRMLGFSRYEYFGIRTRLEAERRFTRGRQRTHSGSKRRYDERWHDRQSDSSGPMRQASIDLHEAYKRLNLSLGASLFEVKKAYRRAISQHHPDKLTARGASPEQVLKATQETQRIQKAYEVICRTHSDGF